MIPLGINPVCHRMPMTIPDFVGQQKSKRTDGNQAKRPGELLKTIVIHFVYRSVKTFTLFEDM